MVGGIILEDTGCLVAPGDLDRDIPGMTDRGFTPPASSAGGS
jgi:hypothetical protein